MDNHGSDIRHKKLQVSSKGIEEVRRIRVQTFVTNVVRVTRLEWIDHDLRAQNERDINEIHIIKP